MSYATRDPRLPRVRESCPCCGTLLPLPRHGQPEGYCDLCDGGPNVRTSPPHVCEKSDRLIPDEHGCPPEWPA